MSRSNGPGVPPNGWPGVYPPADPQNPYQQQYPAQQGYPAQPQYAQPQYVPATQPVTAGRPARIQQSTQGRAPQSAPGGYAQPPQGYAPQQSYQGQPGYGVQQPYAAPQAPQQAYPQGQQYAPARQNPLTQPPQSAYAPQSDRTAPPQAYAPQYQPQAPQQTYASLPQSSLSAPGNYQQWQPGSPSIDPQGYDLGAYMPAPGQPDPAQSQDWRTGRPAAPPAWSASQAQPSNAAYDRFDAPGQRQDHDFGSIANQLDNGYDHHAGTDDHDDDYEDEADSDASERPSRPRYAMIMASIVAAFAIGGGLTYAYKVFAGHHEQVANAPVVKSGSDPFKVKPADAGGTKFANGDAKVMDQLSGSDGGPRVVQTMKVERDGTITSGASAAQAPGGGVPGMILVGGQPPGQSGPNAAAAGSLLAAAATPAAPAKPAKPAAVVAAAAPAPDEVPAPATAAPVSKKVPKKPLAAAAGIGGPPPAAAGANGFVAVLASLPASGSSRMQAMQQFADLQQKYTDVLGNKAPDVVEAKVADKGTFHRLVVGPPASRDSAKSVCDKLKASGYTADCWVTAF